MLLRSALALLALTHANPVKVEGTKTPMNIVKGVSLIHSERVNELLATLNPSVQQHLKEAIANTAAHPIDLRDFT
jgi:hypothetical protein